MSSVAAAAAEAATAVIIAWMIRFVRWSGGSSGIGNSWMDVVTFAVIVAVGYYYFV